RPEVLRAGEGSGAERGGATLPRATPRRVLPPVDLVTSKRAYFLDQPAQRQRRAAVRPLRPDLAELRDDVVELLHALLHVTRVLVDLVDHHVDQLFQMIDRDEPEIAGRVLEREHL